MKSKTKFINEFGEKEEVKADEFKDTPNLELRLQQIANVALNHFCDHGEEVAYEYILLNVPKDQQNNFKKTIQEVAKQRGLWEVH